MKSIKEKAKELEIEVFRTTRSKDVAERCKWSYIKGANYVLEAIQNCIKDIDLGSAEEKFYKLDVIADIGLFVEQLKK